MGLVPFGAAGIAITSMLLATVPGGAAGHPAVAGYYWSCFWLLALGMTAGLYDIPLQAFLQDRSPAESRGSIMAAYNFMAFAGMLAASGVYWLLSSPHVLGLSARSIFLVGGLVTVPVTFFIIRRLPFQTTHLAVRSLVACMYRLRVEGRENVPPTGGALLVANHVSWADGVLLGLACPRHPRMVAYAKYFESPWLGWFGRLSRIIPIGTTRKSMAESIRVAREALQQGEMVCIFPEGGITRSGQIEEFRPGFLSILKDTDVPVVPVYLDGLWGSIFSYEGGRCFWKFPRSWRRPITIRFGRADSRSGRRRRGPPGGGRIALKIAESLKGGTALVPTLRVGTQRRAVISSDAPGRSSEVWKSSDTSERPNGPSVPQRDECVLRPTRLRYIVFPIPRASPWAGRRPPQGKRKREN